METTRDPFSPERVELFWGSQSTPDAQDIAAHRVSPLSRSAIPVQLAWRSGIILLFERASRAQPLYGTERRNALSNQPVEWFVRCQPIRRAHPRLLAKTSRKYLRSGLCKLKAQQP